MRPDQCSILFTLFFSLHGLSTSKEATLRVGAFFTRTNSSLIGLNYSIGALFMAKETIERERLLPGYALEIVPILVVGGANDTKMHKQVMCIGQGYDDYDVIIGPEVSSEAELVGYASNIHSIPVFPWGLATDSSLRNSQIFGKVTSLSTSSLQLALAVQQILVHFGWKRFGYIYSSLEDIGGDNPVCGDFKDDLKEFVAGEKTTEMAEPFMITEKNRKDLTNSLASLKDTARIFVVCLPEMEISKREFVFALKDADMLTDQYVYIMADYQSRGFKTLRAGELVDFWQDSDAADSDNQLAKDALTRVFLLTDHQPMDVDDSTTRNGMNSFYKEVAEKSNMFTGSNISQDLMSPYAPQLHDALYLYARTVHKTLKQRGTDIRKFDYKALRGMTFQGYSGQVKINENEVRTTADFYLLSLDEQAQTRIRAVVQVDESQTKFKPKYEDEGREMWWNRGGQTRPMDREMREKSSTSDEEQEDAEQRNPFWDLYKTHFIVGFVVLFLLLIFTAVYFRSYFDKLKLREKDRLDAQWNIALGDLQEPGDDDLLSRKIVMVSDRSPITRSPSTGVLQRIQNSGNFAVFMYEKQPVITYTFEATVSLEAPYKAEMRVLRKLENDNINRFLGLCREQQLTLSVWRFCSRGNLKNIIRHRKMQLDNVFSNNILRDIVNGLSYLHNSPLKIHGNLTSESCLVDDRFQVKLSYYGLAWLRCIRQQNAIEKLWTAPELLRVEDVEGSVEGDVYSFAIIASEIMTLTDPWDINRRKETAEEVIEMIKANLPEPIRPSLELSTASENIRLKCYIIKRIETKLVCRCWAEQPAERPKIEEIKEIMNEACAGRRGTLMDHVFRLLEDYAGSLEKQVDARLKDLVQERLRSDKLLYQMLPNKIGDALRQGRTVEPELFESVSVASLSIVNFAELTVKMTPNAVVRLLKEMNTVFLRLVQMNEVYMVDTGPDSTLCVSGLPVRNGTRHVKDIVEMTSRVLSEMKGIPLMADDATLKIRVGVHSGRCTAGIIGERIKRYWLFGETVDIAKKLEESGEAGRIHISSSTQKLLSDKYPEFVTELRGDTKIEDYGSMRTYWIGGPPSNVSSPSQ